MTHFAILCTGGSRLGTVASGWLDLTTVVTNLGLGRAAAVRLGELEAGTTEILRSHLQPGAAVQTGGGAAGLEQVLQLALTARPGLDITEFVQPLTVEGWAGWRIVALTVGGVGGGAGLAWLAAVAEKTEQRWQVRPDQVRTRLKVKYGVNFLLSGGFR